jgi:hypothetical protein
VYNSAHAFTFLKRVISSIGGRLPKGKNFSKGHIFIKMIERIKAKLAEIPMHWDPPGAA